MKANPDVDIKIPFPAQINCGFVREVRISPAGPTCGGCPARFFEVEYIFNDNRAVTQFPLDENRIMGIDLGVDNLAACVTTTGQAFLIDGRVLKSANQWYNKEKARLQSINDKHNRKGKSLKMACLVINREDFITDYMRKATRYIVDFCVTQGIGTLVVGVNKDQKQDINIGHVNNQNFVQIPFWKFRRLLKNLCERYGIVYVEVEESYTSKTSFLDRDVLPTYDPSVDALYSFSGRRIVRGLYRSKKGCINSDVNGAANIIRKYRPDTDFSVLDKAVVLNLRRVMVLRTARKKPHACPIKSKAAA